jgi:hypothetical protein
MEQRPDGPKALMIDADNRGGIRQGNEVLTVASIKQALKADPSLRGNQELLCSTYARLFYGGVFLELAIRPVRVCRPGPQRLRGLFAGGLYLAMTRRAVRSKAN